MTTRAQLLAEMDAIEAVARRLEMVGERTDPTRKADLASARRELAMRMMTIMAVGEDYAPIRQNLPVYHELRQRLSLLRTTIAEHQSRWSAVAIDSDDTAYLASSRAVQNAGRDFMHWVRRMVMTLPDGACGGAGGARADAGVSAGHNGEERCRSNR